MTEEEFRKAAIKAIEDQEERINIVYEDANHDDILTGMEWAKALISSELDVELKEYALLDAYVLYHAEVIMEDDIMKIKWQHGDKHYIVPFGWLLELWEKYEEHEHESSIVISERKE